MAQAKLEVLIKAKDEASKTLTGINGKIQGMSKQLRMAGIGMVAAGGAITGTLALSIKSFAKAGDEVAKMSARTGFSTEAISELKHAAEICGAGIGDLEKGVKRMATVLYDADMGLKTSTDALDSLGLSMKDFEGLSPEQQFFTLANAIADVEDPTLKAALAQKIFGKSGTDLLPLFDEGSEGMAKLRLEAHDLGIVFDQEAAKKAENLTDAMHRVNEATSGLKMAIAEQLIPILIPLIQRVTEIVKGIRKWADKHPELFRMITIITGAVGLLLIPLGGLLIMMTMLTAVSLPWLLIISAIIVAFFTLIAAGILIWQNWEMLSEKAKKLVSWFRSIYLWVKEIYRIIYSWFLGAIQGIINYIESLIATLSRLFSMFRRTTTGGDGGWQKGGEVGRGERVPIVVTGAQKGGAVLSSGLAYLHKGETVLPAKAPIVIHNYITLDGRIIGENVVEYIGDQVRLQGAL